MTQGVKDLINAISEGDSVAIEAAFNSEMASRISDRLETMRQEVAQNMFATESVQVEETKLTEEELIELEAYMQTEDFEQLDELSKATLSSYVKKAATSKANARADARDFAMHDNTPARERTAERKANFIKSIGTENKRTNGIEKAVNKLAK